MPRLCNVPPNPLCVHTHLLQTVFMLQNHLLYGGVGLAADVTQGRNLLQHCNKSLRKRGRVGVEHVPLVCLGLFKSVVNLKGWGEPETL